MISLPVLQDPMVRYNYTNTTLTGASADYSIDELEGEMVQSVIDGTPNVIVKGERFSGEIVVSGISKATYDALKAMKRQTVRLWPFGAGAVTGALNKYYPWTDVLIQEVRPYHKDSLYFVDGAVIKFISLAYYTLDYATSLGYTEA